ncbi:MAG: helix-turn-helix domain containing protein [Terracidiphilus sp.]|nr:helix-turn-helix domain containing protein [Terracidiphilus sp.]
MTEPASIRTQAERADQARARILDAATREFSSNGLAGARTERIAETAGVNKALIYYYYRGKEALYAATLEAVAGRMAAASFSVLTQECSAGERLLRIALNHFDRIYSQSVFQSLLQQEMIRLRNGESHAQSPLVEMLFRPMGQRMLAVAEEGIRSAELIAVESSQLMYAIFGPNVFYFLSAPMMNLVADTDPLHPAALEFRRRAAIEYLGQALFIDRNHGSAIAACVLADTPMPQLVEPPAHPFQKLRTGKNNIEAASSSAVEARHN